MDLIQKLAALSAQAKSRQQKQSQPCNATPAAAAPAAVIPFPAQWGGEVRGAPDICLRSALFGVVKPGKRRDLKDELLAAQDGYEVRYTGERLDQNDLDVWQQVIHLCRTQPVGERVYFTLKGFLKAIGRQSGKPNRRCLAKSLDRMVACAVILKSQRYRYANNLLNWGLDEETGRFYVRVNPEMAPFFQHDQYTLIDFQRRLSLPSQLARWLHDYYSTYAQPYPLKITTIRGLCGSETSELFHFRAELRKALEELVQAGLLTGWEIAENDLVSVRKRPSASQGRHLVRDVVKTGRKPREPKK